MLEKRTTRITAAIFKPARNPFSPNERENWGPKKNLNPKEKPLAVAPAITGMFKPRLMKYVIPPTVNTGTCNICMTIESVFPRALFRYKRTPAMTETT